MKKKSKIEKYTDQEALDYHNSGKAGKIEINSSKPMSTQRDLALAYSPGVAAPVKVIAENPDAAYDNTTKGNLVAVISNGSAILGLGNLGALAAKPVMEGKAILFKRFADINAIDLEIDSSDPNEIINSITKFGKSFGGINLEDIAAPDCFIIEQKLKETLDIPVFHDDQHGTAITTLAGLINAFQFLLFISKFSIYTLLFFGGLLPLCGIGVVSLIEIILKPLACNALKAVSLPEPGPFTSTDKYFIPHSRALAAAASAAT